MNACDELVDFLAGNIPSSKLANFHSSEDGRCVWTLIEKEKQSRLLTESAQRKRCAGSGMILWPAPHRRLPWRMRSQPTLKMNDPLEQQTVADFALESEAHIDTAARMAKVFPLVQRQIIVAVSDKLEKRLCATLALAP